MKTYFAYFSRVFRWYENKPNKVVHGTKSLIDSVVGLDRYVINSNNSADKDLTYFCSCGSDVRDWSKESQVYQASSQ